jgi:hypothetical protein
MHNALLIHEYYISDKQDKSQPGIVVAVAVHCV